MRDYLFRGKRKDNNKWTYGSLILDVDVCRIHVYGTGLSREVFPVTVGQYTGLKDKKGIDIYEGDLLKIAGRILPVIYDKASFCTPTQTSTYRLGNWVMEAVENIGNIHDHPLLNPPADSPASNTMNIDPNAPQAAENQEAKAIEEAPQNQVAPEQATEQADAEEGGTQG